MTDFTASNGVGVFFKGLDAQVVVPREWYVASLSPKALSALSEFFSHQRDIELGRWRSKQHPTVVVYPDPLDADNAFVLDEDNAEWGEVSRMARLAPTAGDSAFFAAAREFFAAHPEPKPWHNAQPGELWALTGAGGLEQAWLRTRDERWAHATSESLRLYAKPEGIIAGRRIYPEVQS